MAKKLSFKELDAYFESGKDFEIINAQYKEITSRDLPKRKSYLVNSSPLTKKANEYGYSITVKEEPIIFRKVLLKKGKKPMSNKTPTTNKSTVFVCHRLGKTGFLL